MNENFLHSPRTCTEYLSRVFLTIDDSIGRPFQVVKAEEPLTMAVSNL